MRVPKKSCPTKLLYRHSGSRNTLNWRKIDHCDINELFAIYLICGTLYQTGRLTKPITGKESYSTKLRYSFRYRNFTIDSFIVLAESINSETFDMK
jgi:hypothetical protein